MGHIASCVCFCHKDIKVHPCGSMYQHFSSFSRGGNTPLYYIKDILLQGFVLLWGYYEKRCSKHSFLLLRQGFAMYF